MRSEASPPGIAPKDDPLRPLGHAAEAPFLDIRLRQLEKRGIHRGVAAARPHLLDDEVQVGVGLLLTAAVRDEQQGGSHGASPPVRFSPPFYGKQAADGICW